LVGVEDKFNFFTTFKDALMNYDTPRNLKEIIDSSESSRPSGINPMGNYDIPHPGSQPIPVFKKQCGCIMKLNQAQKGIYKDLPKRLLAV